VSVTVFPPEAVDRARTATPTALVTALGLAAAIVASLLALRGIRLGEAILSTAVLQGMGTGAERFGTTVIVDSGAGRAGFTIATGCSTALLAIPFLGVGALALASGRVPVRRTLTALGFAVAGVVLLNQVRFGVIGGAIHVFGYERGYGQSHVLIGTLISTIGLVAGLAAFGWSLSRGEEG
jgi:exosortase/archaeosortase family protein